MINYIEIQQCKSIKVARLNLDEINCLLGKNGTGKTNLISSINFFYQRLTDETKINSLKDRDNPFLDYQSITIEFDFNKYRNIITSAAIFEIFGSSTDNDFNKKIFDFKKYLTNYTLKLNLQIDSLGNAVWTPRLSKEHRAFIKSLFPIYFISSRNINLVDWQNLWTIMGEIGRFQLADFETSLETFFIEKYGENYAELLQKIREILASNEIDFRKLTASEKFSQLLQIQLGGKEFTFKNESLDYFSDGMNSYNFIQLFCEILNDLSKQKLKQPILIIDEPEIGLHPKYIDKVSDVFMRLEGKPQLVISTHSSRMVKNFVQKKSKVELFHLSLKNNYTNVLKMVQPEDVRENSRITESETSCYFSSAIVFLEGATEIELFTNQRIMGLFPFLQDIDFIAGDSVTLKMVHPNEKNTNIPYLIVVDMDKIIKLKGKRVIIKNEDINPLRDSAVKDKIEKYYYGKKRISTYQTRKRIKALIDVCNFKYSQAWFTIEEEYFHLLKGLIQTYCEQYNVYPVDTTIEGSVVTKQNFQVFASWLQTKKNNDKRIETLLDSDVEDSVKLTWFRLIVKGKYDILQKCITDDEQKKLTPDQQQIYKIISILGIGFSKASGWTIEWLNYFFDNYIDTESTQYQKEQNFKIYFSELYDIIKRMEHLVR